MNKRVFASFLPAIALASLATSASAQDGTATVSAADPEGMQAALTNAGYSAELGTDAVDDPKITLRIDNWRVGVFFYGCDQQTHDGCDSVQLLTGFDRAEPMPAKLALEISQSLRYAAVQLDDEGDPFIGWDIYTGKGIPLPVFLAAIRAYERTLVDAATIIFAEEGGQ